MKSTATIVIACLIAVVCALLLKGTAVSVIEQFSMSSLDKSARAQTYADKGNYFFSQGHYDVTRAVANFEKATALDPFLPQVHYQLGRLYFLEGSYDKALWQIEQELVVNPTFGKSNYMKGLILGYMGKYPESAAAFGKFITSDPINWAGYNDLSWVYFSAGDFASAKQAAEVGLGYAAGNPWLLNSLGVAELGLKNTTAAQKAFTAALQSLETMGPADWGRAYPGNDPRIYTQGYDSMKESITNNLKKVR